VSMTTEDVSLPAAVGAVARRVYVGAGHSLAGLVAAGTFLLAFANGMYVEERWTALAVAVWWAVLVVAVVGARGARWSRAGLATTVLLAAFVSWTLASVSWAGSAEAAYTEFVRSVLYLGLLVLVVLVARRDSAGYWSDGLALGIVAVAALALASRLFPSVAGSESGAGYLPSLQSRLSYPVGYWNGLGILMGIGAPLVIGSALRARVPLARALFLAGLPLLAATIYLTSSRGAFATAAAGFLVFLVLSRQRWQVLGAVLLGGAASGIAVLVLSRRVALANGQSGVVATNEARSASGWFAIICIATAAAYLGARLAPRPKLPPRAVGWVLAGAAVLAAASLAVAAHPIRRFEEFKRPPVAGAVAPHDFVQAHLLSASGSGRWQFWQAAVAEYHSGPLIGRGAGSYAEWWAQRGTLAKSIQNAHSLYLETLGELGVVGFVLLLAALIVASVAVIRAARDREHGVSSPAAGLGAAFVAFLVAAGIDWVWELTVVSVVAFVCLGLVLVLEAEGARVASSLLGSRVSRALAAVLALVVICAEGVPMLTQVRIGNSQRAARQGRSTIALAEARAAVRVQPWAASPYLQLALVQEQAGALNEAEATIQQAIQRDGQSWQLHLVAARIETELGRIPAARRSYERARSLDPRSPLFAASP
jgi:O-Antigen ligase